MFQGIKVEVLRKRSCLDVLGAIRANLLIGTFYLGGVGAALATLILFFMDTEDSRVPTLGFVVAVATPFLHAVLGIASKLLIKGYLYLSVPPAALFIAGDFLQGFAFGAGLIGYTNDSSDATWQLIANFVLLFCHGLHVYKTGTIAYEVYTDMRDSVTAAPLRDDGKLSRREAY